MYITLVTTRSIAIRLGVISAASIIGRCCVSCYLLCLLVLAVISIIVIILVHRLLVVIVVLYVFVIVVCFESGRSGAGSLGLQHSVAFVVARRRVRIDGRRRRTLRTNHRRVKVTALGTLLGATV
jgi:hypothetical protein